MMAVVQLAVGLGAAVHVSAFWQSGNGDPRCTCVVDAPSFPDPNRAVLELLEKQLNRCGPEQQTCPACPQCPPIQPHCPAAPTVAPAAAVSLMLGVLLGRLSHLFERKGSSDRSVARRDVGVRGEPPGEHRDELERTANWRGDGGWQAGDARCEAAAVARGEVAASGARLERQEARGGVGQHSAFGTGDASDYARHAYGRDAAEGVETAARGDAVRQRYDEDGDDAKLEIIDEDRGEGLDDEDEAKLGIIDAGDDEWLEVHDVIKEHSAVTIFNHTDSTWYVSSKHPHFVRPLHGKHRHKHRQQLLNAWPLQPWLENAANAARHGFAGTQFPDGGAGAADAANAGTAAAAGAAAAAANAFIAAASAASSRSHTMHVAHTLPQAPRPQRPHSAPSPAYGRPPAANMRDRRGDAATCHAQHWSNQPAVGGGAGQWRSGDGHLRCASVD